MTLPSNIETLVQAHLGQTFSACALTVIEGGEGRISAAWGYTDTPHDMYSVAPDETYFDLASVTKLFVETTLLTLISAGRATLDTRLVEVLPSFDGPPRPISGGKDPHTNTPLDTPAERVGQSVRPSDVTLRHLLTHQSGLAPWVDIYTAAGAAPAPPTTFDRIPRATRWRRATGALMRAPFVDAVGANVHYSDLGLMLIALVIEALTGDTLDGAVRAAVVEPLALAPYITYNPMTGGIPRTQIAPTEYDARWRGRRVWGEVHDENACGIGGVSGHAGLFGTAEAVARFGEAWRTRDPRLAIDPALMDAATSRQAGTDAAPYGLGWMLRSTGPSSAAGTRLSRRTYGHTGFTGTSLWIDPDRALTVALMTNRVYMGREHVGVQAFRAALHDLL